MKNKSIYDALPIVATAYGDKFGVKIKVGGVVAYTNGNEINIPNIPDSFGNMDVIWGYLAHEAAHVRFTDFNVSRHSPLHAELVNIIEDCRIEQLMIKRYPGTDQTLNAVASYMANEGHYSMVSKDQHPASIISAYSLYYLQGLVVGQQAIIPFFQSAQEAIKEVFPQAVQQRLTALLNEAAFCASTQEACDLANKIIDMLDEEAEAPEPDDSSAGDDSGAGDSPDDDSSAGDDSGAGDSSDDDSSAGDDSGAGDSSDDDSSAGDDSGAGDSSDDDSSAGNDSGAGDSSDDDSSAGNDSGAGDSSDDDSSAGDDSGAGDSSDDDSSAGDDSGAGDSSDDDSSAGDDSGAASPSKSDQKRDAIKQAIKAEKSDLLGDATDKLRQDLAGQADPDDRFVEYRTHADENLGSRVAGKNVIDNARAKSSGISQRLHGLVQAKQRNGYRNTRKGSLNNKRIAQVVSGNTKVFKRRDETVAPNTAIHILVDMSGSMASALPNGEFCYSVAQESAAALALALEPIKGVSSAVTYFESEVKAVKRRNETVASKIASFGSQPTNTTALAEAMWFAGYELSQCKEDRKVIMVITDGEPDCQRSVKKITKLCTDSGIEVLAIGIKTDSVLALFKSSVVIESALDLKTELFKLIENVIV